MPKPIIRLLDIRRDYSEVEHIWRTLESNATSSYFLSWSWVENWLALLPPEAQLQLAVVTVNGKAKLAFFCGSALLCRHHLFVSRGCFLNETGLPECDQLYIERNGMLCDDPALSLPEVLKHLPLAWDEFFVSGVTADSFLGRCLEGDIRPYRLQTLATKASPFVDLGRVRDAGGDYLSLLSANTRAQVRRAYRAYQERGQIKVFIAKNLSEAVEIFEEMVKLHQYSWQARGHRGAFASPFVYRFHRRLIERYYHTGELQLIRVSAGDATIGCTYSFVRHGRVHFYQGGLAYEADNRFRPGMVCHTEAVRHNAGEGQSIYDFLGGNARYKQSLSTNETTLVWAKIQKPRLRFLVEDKLGGVARALKPVPGPTHTLMQEP